jgi:IS5 family transposase
MRQFTGFELGDDRIPDETTILNCRHLLEKHRLTDRNRPVATAAIVP